MMIDQIRDVDTSVQLSGDFEFKSLVGPSTKGILAKEQEAELDVVMIPLLKQIFLSPEEGHATQTR